jgi:hypothetical protein
MLGIAEATTTYDDAIEAKISYIDVTVKRLTKNKYNMQVVGTTTINTKTLNVYGIYSYAGQIFDALCYSGFTIEDILTPGQQLEGTGIPSGTYITDLIPSANYMALVIPRVELSSNATATGQVSLWTGIPIDLQQVIAKGIWWLIQNDSTIIKDENWTSRSMGSLSVSRSDSDSKIDMISGMPLWFVKAFPRFQGAY